MGQQDAVRGRPEAPVTVVAFVDAECPFCAQTWQMLEVLAHRFGPERLRIVVKHCPISDHELALVAAVVGQVVLEERGTEAFWGFFDRLFERQGRISRADLERSALASGVELERLRTRLANPSDSAYAKVRRDLDLAGALGIIGTPHLRINGRPLTGLRPLEQLVSLVEEELEETHQLGTAGVRADRIYAQRVASNFRPESPDEESGRPEPPVVWPVELGSSPQQGPRDALVTVVQFADFECPFCAEAELVLEQVRQRYPAEVRVVFKHLPLDSHRYARKAGRLALEMRSRRGDQSFFAAKQALFARRGRLSEAVLREVAQELGLGVRDAELVLASTRHDAVLERDLMQAQELEVEGVPQFFVNGVRLVGLPSTEEFLSLVEAELEKARAMVGRGVPRSRVYSEILRTATGRLPERRPVPPVTAASPTRGPARAPVEIQVFSDFECPLSRRVQPTLQRLDRAYPGRIRWVWRNLPLPVHPHARTAAHAALEAFAQQGARGFWQMHDLLFLDQGRTHGFEPEALESHARRLGLDLARFRRALADGRHEPALQADERAALDTHIDQTPAFLINGYFLSGAQPFGVFRRVVEQVLRESAPR